jgi:hypothetical protein
MPKRIHVFKSFEEQEFFFLEYFADMTPSQRLQELDRIQKKNHPLPTRPSVKKITLRKHFFYGCDK